MKYTMLIGAMIKIPHILIEKKQLIDRLIDKQQQHKKKLCIMRTVSYRCPSKKKKASKSYFIVKI